MERITSIQRTYPSKQKMGVTKLKSRYTNGFLTRISIKNQFELGCCDHTQRMSGVKGILLKITEEEGDGDPNLKKCSFTIKNENNVTGELTTPINISSRTDRRAILNQRVSYTQTSTQYEDYFPTKYQLKILSGPLKGEIFSGGD